MKDLRELSQAVVDSERHSMHKSSDLHSLHSDALPLHPVRSRSTFLGSLVLSGVLVPLVYFGVQLVTSRGYPGYSFVANTASELGSDRSPWADAFNITVMALGVVIAVFGASAAAGLRALRTQWWRIVPLVIAVLTMSVQTFWAAYFPLPDPRHGGHPVFVVGMILLVPSMLLALWNDMGVVGRGYFIFTLVHVGVMILIFTGRILPEAFVDAAGLKQRLFTLALFPPFGVAAVVIWRRLQGGKA
jgi:hypothetical membrane protein